MKTKYVVFGVKNHEDDLLIEIHTESPRKVAVLTHLHSDAGYKARVWNTHKHRFVRQAALERYIACLNK